MGKFFHVKLLLSSGIFPPDIGGPATFIPRLAEYANNQHFDVTVLSLKPAGYIPSSTPHKTILVKRNFLPIRALKTVFQSIKLVSRSDLIFANGLYLEVGIAVRIFRKSAVAKIVGDPVWELCQRNGRTQLSITDFQKVQLSPKYKILRYIYLFAFNSFSVITCPSQELAGLVAEWGYKGRIQVIPNGVRIPTLEDKHKEFDFIYVGRLVKWKRVDRLIELCSELKLSAVIVGAGPEEVYLRELALKLGAECLFTGELSKSELRNYLKTSKMFALLSQYEGLSYSLIEAFAVGLPALVSSAKGNTDVVTHGFDGIVIDPENLKESQTEILEVLSNEKKLHQYGKNARSTAEQKYNEIIRLKEMLNLIRSHE